MVYTPPCNISIRDRKLKSIFLAGTIEMGKSEDWQSEMIKFIEAEKGLNLPFFTQEINIFNPRRKDWDSTWNQCFENPNFFQQVTWELNALKESDLIIMYFDPTSLSPISLLELGLFATSDKLHVVCPEGFWRKGNVDIVCNLYNIPLYNTLEDFKNFLYKNYLT